MFEKDFSIFSSIFWETARFDLAQPKYFSNNKSRKLKCCTKLKRVGFLHKMMRDDYLSCKCNIGIIKHCRCVKCTYQEVSMQNIHVLIRNIQSSFYNQNLQIKNEWKSERKFSLPTISSADHLTVQVSFYYFAGTLDESF